MDWDFSEKVQLDFYLCSIRSGMIFGPAKIRDLQEQGFGRIHWEGEWLGPPRLDEWEGYAVCVPARQEVWGVCKPTIANGIITADMEYVCQPMPESDSKIFLNPPISQRQRR